MPRGLSRTPIAVRDCADAGSRFQLESTLGPPRPQAVETIPEIASISPIWGRLDFRRERCYHNCCFCGVSAACVFMILGTSLHRIVFEPPFQPSGKAPVIPCTTSGREGES